MIYKTVTVYKTWHASQILNKLDFTSQIFINIEI
jgi:hypothetical protein